MSAVLDRGAALSAEQKRALLKRKLTEAATATHPLSHGQQALWFLHQMAPYSAAYNIAFAVRVRSHLDLARLTRAFQVLTARHGSLRTTFPTLEGRPVQRVDAHRAFHLEQTDVGGWSAQEVHRRVVETYRRPFDLESGPLLRAHLFTLADDDSVLLLSGHHIIGDGWSLWTLLEEWRTLYEDADAGAAALAPLAFDYADHVRLQEEMLAGPRGESLRAYWHERLAGALPPLALPTDRPRPAIQRHRGASIPFAFSAESTRALRALAKAEGVTLYTLLLGAYQVLLHRYCAQDSILVGSPMAGRTHQAYAGVVGYFVNPVVLRADLSGSPSFRDVLRQARDTVLGALAHQDYPFSLLVEQLRAGRDASRHPLFQVSFMLQKSQQSDEFIGLMASAQGTRRVEWKNLSLEPYELMQQEGQFDLTLEIVESSAALVGVLKYSTDLYERATIERMAGHYARLLEAIVADPAAPIAGLELIPDAERALLAQWNRTEREYRHDASVHALIEEQVRRTPHATALSDEDDALTYKALDERADRLARRLSDLGVGRDVRVGICVERSLDMVVGLLAILKAGGAYLPLDPDYPAERIGFMLHDAGVGVVVTQEALLGLVGSAGARVLCLDRDRESIERTGDAGSAASQVSSEDLAYVIYTSGSTGKPKGVMVRHRNVVNFFTGMDDAIGAGEGAAGEQPVWLAVTSISFDISVLELFWTLARGYRVVISREQPGASAIELLNRHRVTHLQCTPSFLRMLIDQDGAADALRGLSALLVGGEPLAPSLAQRVAGLTHAALFNMYGPTETTVWSTVKRVDGPVGHSVPIGRPIANTRVQLLDATLQPVPVGVAGELYIGGAGVTRGYLHRPDLTEARFVADRFCDEPDARMYRTGDIARYSGEGELVFLGRADDQVKVRGHRIEIGEIEFALSRHPAVRNAAVAVRVDALDARLVGYVAAADDAAPGAGELRRFLAAQLPEYMIPAAFVFLDALPLTPNGKIDRRALPAADGGAVASAARYEAPATETERAIAAVWQALLGIGSVGVHDNFFELGGHSLLATQMVSRLRSALAADVPLRAVFDTPTLRELAARVETLRGAGAGSDAEPILPVARTQDLPLSFAQQRLWFLGQLETGHAAVYNNSAALRLTGELDAGRVRRVLCEIVARHEALRTTFADREGTPIQVVHAALDWDVALDDLRGLAEAQREDSLQRLIAEEAASVFDLTTGPLFRARLVRCADHDHVLIATTHHIVSDGWSMGVMTTEFAVLYAAFGKGDTSPLPALTLHYADYAAWQRQRLQGAALDAQLQYWRAELANAPAVLELPTDRPRPAAQSFRGATLHFELPRELLGQLKALAQHAGATLFMTLLAGFATLLSRYSGQSEVVIGSPIANRTRTELEPLIGFFVNTLALRTDLSADPSFAALLERVKRTTLDAYARQDVPFEKLVEALQPARSLSHSPLFQVMFVLQNAPMGAMEIPGLAVSALPVQSASAKFDLTWVLEEGAHGLTGSVEYSTDLFDAGTVERMVGHYTRLLDAIVSDPEQAVSRLALIPDAERARLARWNRNETAYRHDGRIHEAIAEQVRRTPGSVAISHEGESLTYAALDERADRLARDLVSLGVAPEVRVGVCVERSLDMVVALLAILKAGGAYLPLDPDYPAERLDFMLRDAEVAVVLAHERLLPLVAHSGARVVCLDRDRESLGQRGRIGPNASASAEDLAYLIYTSGSTGKPKGVMVGHRNVMNFFAGMDDVLGAPALGDAQPVWLAVSSICFDISVLELFWTLARGYHVVIQGERRGESKTATADLLRRHRATHLQCTPTLLQMLLDEDSECLRDLNTLVVGGEALLPGLARRVAGVTGATLFNMYGPTETTVWCTTHAVGAVGHSVPIGKPIGNMQIHLLDDKLQPVPVGVAGEVYVGGAGVARGYLNRPELNEARFVADPFCGEPGARMYRSGDIARHTGDGELLFLGRVDHQVKIRGFRIEMGEIEVALSQHPAVKAAAVTVREEAGDKRLVGYVAAAAAPDVAALRCFLAQQLPEYMIPSAFVFLEALPLTPNGKIDRHALPAPDGAAVARANVYEAPASETEKAIAAVWQALLQVERVGVHDNFFELGGHSLLATQMVSRLRTALHAELPLRGVFEAPTLRALAARIDELRGSGAGDHVGAIVPVARTQDLALSFAQQRLWFLDRLGLEHAAVYNNSAALRLTGALDAARVQRVLQEIVARHEALRTTFVDTDDGTPIQVVHAALDWELRIDDLRDLAQIERVAALARLIDDEARGRLDLTTGPLFRARLVRCGHGDHVLIATTHHIISDGWSMGVMIREFAVLYDAFGKGAASPLAPLPIQYVDYAAWQRNRMQGAVLDAGIAYWREQLAHVPVLSLPTPRTRPAVQSYRGALHRFEIPRLLRDRLAALGAAHGTTAFMNLLAAFAVLLHRYSGQADIAVGTPIANRTRTELESLIGFFVNTLVLRVDLAGDPGFDEVLARVRRTTLDAYAHQDVPFEKLVEALQPVRSLSHAPLFQVMFVLQNAPMDALELPGLSVTPLPVESGSAKFDLLVVLEETAHGLKGTIEYSTDLFDAATIERMAGHYLSLLGALAAQPAQAISRAPLLAAAERHQLLVEWNDTGIEYPRDRYAHELFEAQAGRTPHAPAVQCGAECLSYAELNARANRLAHYLRSIGVGRESVVGVCLERSIDMVVALHAVLKAGGAYLPLDPEYPAERLDYMAADADIGVLLTHSALRERWCAEGRRVIALDTEWPRIAQAPAGNPGTALTPDDIAYVIYTSGSTGTPKGVAVPHRGLLNRLHWMQAQYPLDASDVVLQKTPYSFDVSVWEFFWPFMTGAALAVAGAGDHRDSARLVSLIREHRVTTLHFVPSMLSAFLADPGAASCVSLRRTICSGEALPYELQQRFFATFDACELHNLYGPTEASIDVSYWECRRDSTDAVVPIGAPIGNIRLYILDAHLEPVPIGVAGELHIGGVGLARGYLNKPELTQEKFIADPFGVQPGDRLYKTGDLARHRPDGNIEYLGRLDHQVKVRGYRIELGEIEAAILKHPGVREAVVVAREDRTGDKRLVAYAVPQAPGAPGDDETGEARSAPEHALAADLRQQLGKTLPAFMVPSAFVMLDSMPLGANGKVDRNSLPAAAGAESAKEYVAPRNATEGIVARIWTDILGVERIGVEDNFFDLGGHSLLGAQLVARLRDAFGIEVPLRVLFEVPALAGLADYVDTVLWVNREAVRSALAVGDNEEEVTV